MAKKTLTVERNPVALFLTDTHLKESNIELVTDIFKQAIEVAKQHRLTTIYHLGDSFQSRKGQTEIVLNTFKDIITRCQIEGIDLKEVPGNHDKMSYDSVSSYLNVYAPYSNFELIQDYDYESLGGGLFLHLIPYFREGELYQKYLNKAIAKAKQLSNNAIHILGTHIAINGVKNNDGTEVTNGMSQNVFRYFYKVLVGHYHDKTKIGKNIFYIGAALQHNFGEDEEKGFTLLYDNGDHEFVKAKFPVYKKIIIDIDSMSKKDIEKLKKEYFNSPDHIRFKFIGTKAKLLAIDKHTFTESGIDVKIELEDIVDTEEKAAQYLTQFDNKAIKESFKKFCKEKNVESVQLGQHYLDQALN